uniref:Uncharacterized protein n=1 Tax=Arundo donax TaxID=35708 RepID=A0A0A9HII2_ARUDO
MTLNNNIESESYSREPTPNHLHQQRSRLP